MSQANNALLGKFRACGCYTDDEGKLHLVCANHIEDAARNLEALAMSDAQARLDALEHEFKEQGFNTIRNGETLIVNFRVPDPE